MIKYGYTDGDQMDLRRILQSPEPCANACAILGRNVLSVQGESKESS